MKKQAPVFLFLAIFVLAVPASEAGQELSALMGNATFNDTNDESLAWLVEYKNNFHPNIAASVSYLNEGHTLDRKRDGLIVQAWGVTHILENKLSLGLGLGPYRSYNTNRGNIKREWAAIATVSATYDLKAKWFIRADWSRVEHPDDGDSDLFFAGAGYRF
jgi:hypothetical protein